MKSLESRLATVQQCIADAREADWDDPADQAAAVSALLRQEYRLFWAIKRRDYADLSPEQLAAFLATDE